MSLLSDASQFVLAAIPATPALLSLVQTIVASWQPSVSGLRLRLATAYRSMRRHFSLEITCDVSNKPAARHPLPQRRPKIRRLRRRHAASPATGQKLEVSNKHSKC